MGTGSVRRAVAPVLSLLVFAAACGDDDPTDPTVDFGIRTMVVTVGGETVSFGSDGNVTGAITSIPLGTSSVSAQFLGENGQPLSTITPARFTFEVTTTDTLAARYVPGTGFSGEIRAAAPGPLGLTFRLVSGADLAFTRAVGLTVSAGVETVRLEIAGRTLLVPAAGALPGVLDPIPVGTVPVTAAFLAPGGGPAPAITADAFSLVISSSDLNVVRYEPTGPFSGVLRGVAPGIASIAVRLRSSINGSFSFRHVLTVFVE